MRRGLNGADLCLSVGGLAGVKSSIDDDELCSSGDSKEKEKEREREERGKIKKEREKRPKSDDKHDNTRLDLLQKSIEGRAAEPELEHRSHRRFGRHGVPERLAAHALLPPPGRRVWSGVD